MKKYLLFTGGCLTGAVLIMLFLVFIICATDSESDIEDSIGITMFEDPAGTVKEKTFQVLLTISTGEAIVRGGTGSSYLLVNSEGKFYYEGKKIEVPEGKVVRQVGVYQYRKGSSSEKWVPIVKIMDK